MKDKRGIEINLDDTVVYSSRKVGLKYGRVWNMTNTYINVVFPPGTYKSESVCVRPINVLKIFLP